MAARITLGKISLLALSLLSFIPQLYRLHVRGDAIGISPWYVLFNLVMATEQFAVGLLILAVDAGHTAEGIVHHPPNLSDYLNVAQFGAVWLGHLVLGSYLLYLPPARSTQKSAVIAVYLSFLLLSLAMVGLVASIHDKDDLLVAIINGSHALFINPSVTALGVLALIAQLRQPTSGETPGALDLSGLAIQAVVFAVVGIAWFFRLTVPEGFRLGEMAPVRAATTWFQLVGWAAVDNIEFAVVQAVLFVVWWRRRRDEQLFDESAPLLR